MKNCINNVCTPLRQSFPTDAGNTSNPPSATGDSGTYNSAEDAGPVVDLNDPDGDGIPNSEDDDDDNDGLLDIEEIDLVMIAAPAVRYPLTPIWMVS